jgi:uncharacterized protein (DUF4213/DUF364 family)
MILEHICEIAVPRLTGRTIKDVRIGLELLAIELDDGHIGVAYVLRREVEHTCRSFSNAGNLIGMQASDIAKWVLNKDDVISRALGLAVCNSVAIREQSNLLQDIFDKDAALAVNILPEDTIGVIGYIGPVISRLKGKSNPLLIFERDQSMGSDSYSEELQPELLPKCQIVFITSSTLINGTLEKLLLHCKNARDVVMVGASTPLYPEAFEGTGVTVLSGTIWPPENSSQILAGISQCSGMKQLIKYGLKVSIHVNSDKTIE